MWQVPGQPGLQSQTSLSHTKTQASEEALRVKVFAFKPAEPTEENKNQPTNPENGTVLVLKDTNTEIE